MGKKITIDDVEYKRLKEQEQKVTALLDAQKDLTVAMRELVNLMKPHSQLAMGNNIVIRVQGGCVTEVLGLPEDWTYEIDDQDILEEEFTPVEETEDITDMEDETPWRRGANGWQ